MGRPVRVSPWAVAAAAVGALVEVGGGRALVVGLGGGGRRVVVRPERGERRARARAAGHAQLRLDVALGRPAGEGVGRTGRRSIGIQPVAGPGAVVPPRHRPARLPPAVLVHPTPPSVVVAPPGVTVCCRRLRRTVSDHRNARFAACGPLPRSGHYPRGGESAETPERGAGRPARSRQDHRRPVAGPAARPRLHRRRRADRRARGQADRGHVHRRRRGRLPRAGAGRGRRGAHDHRRRARARRRLGARGRDPRAAARAPRGAPEGRAGRRHPPHRHVHRAPAAGRGQPARHLQGPPRRPRTALPRGRHRRDRDEQAEPQPGRAEAAGGAGRGGGRGPAPGARPSPPGDEPLLPNPTFGRPVETVPVGDNEDRRR